MIEDDIIQIEYDDFFQVKQTFQSESFDEKTRSKLVALLETYDCFTKDIIFYAPPSSKHEHRQYGCKKSYMHKRSHYNAYDKPKNPVKEMQGLLNKITASSYHTLLQKIIRCCAYKSCSKDIIEIILNKSFMHGSYSNLYYDILHALYERYEDQVQTVTNNFIVEFISGLTNELEQLKFQPNPNKNYEGYCSFIKRKTRLVAKFETVLIITKEYGVAEWITQMCDIIFAQIIQTLESLNEKPDLVDYFDILSSMILVMKSEKVIDENHKNDIINIQSNISNHISCVPKKIQFCWENIAKS
jgi:hypothetical protein